jgi:2-aminoadipate transaminase
MATAYTHRLSASAHAMRFSAIRRMSALIERPGIISFAPGQPSPETFPMEAIRSIVAEVLERDGTAPFQYIATRGLAPLVEAVSEYARGKGMPTAPAELIITEGSQQALDLVARVLVDPGDVVLLELPSYIGALSAFRAAQARMVGVALDEGGIDLDDLRRRHREAVAEGRRVKLLYVIPNYQNPTGISHNAARREGLLALASELDLLIVEDDPYGELYFEEPPPSTLKSRDASGRVVYLSTFSKILAPGLRTAFILGPEEIVAKIEIAKQAANLCGSGLEQRVTLACLRRGLVELQASRARPYYKDKRDAMLAALAREMPSGVSWSRTGGGLFLWATLPPALDAEVLLERAVAEGVAYVAGGPFFVDGSGANTARLTFAREDGPKIDEGIARLGRAIRAAQSR